MISQDYKIPFSLYSESNYCVPHLLFKRKEIFNPRIIFSHHAAVKYELEIPIKCTGYMERSHEDTSHRWYRVHREKPGDELLKWVSCTMSVRICAGSMDGQYPVLSLSGETCLYKNSITIHQGYRRWFFISQRVTKARNKDEHLSINAEGAGNLFDSIAMEGRGIRKLFILAHWRLQGHTRRLYPARENDEVSPVTHYGESKLLSEQLLREKCETYSLDYNQAPVVYGPLDRDVFHLF